MFFIQLQTGLMAVISPSMVNINPMSRIDSELRSVDAEIERLTAELATAQTKKTELGVAKRILGQIYDLNHGAAAQDEDDDGGKTIADEITAILKKSGPLSKVEIHQQLEELREVNITTVSTTLSRMRSRGEVDNESGKWLISR